MNSLSPAEKHFKFILLTTYQVRQYAHFPIFISHLPKQPCTTHFSDERIYPSVHKPPAKHLLPRPDAPLNLPRIWKRKKKHADASGFHGEEQPGCGRRGISEVSLPFATTIVSANTLWEGWTLLIFETSVARETHSLVLGQCTTCAFDTIDL